MVLVMAIVAPPLTKILWSSRLDGARDVDEQFKRPPNEGDLL
jgi:hypothetical protein